jgi:hypothetical protein
LTQLHTTVTERGQFRSCRRKWYFENVELLAPRGNIAWALEYGTAIHEGLEWYYKGMAEDGVRDLERMLAGFDEKWTETDDKLRSEYEWLYRAGAEQEWWEYKLLGHGMLKNYDRFDRTERLFDEIVSLAIEERSFIDILDLKDQVRKGKPLLSGRIDLVVRRGNDIWIWDHKTASQKPSAAGLDVDDQITGYCYIYWRLTGMVPRGAMYNVLLKHMPAEVKILTSGLPSTDLRQRVTKDDYLAALKKAKVRDLNTKPSKQSTNTFADMIKSIDARGPWSDFFQRQFVPRTEDELRSFHHRLYHESVDQLAVIKQPLAKAYPNPSQRNCMGCGILPLCRTIEERGDIDYVIETMYETKPPRHTVPDDMKEG